MLVNDTIVKIYSHKGELETVTKNVTALGGRIAIESIFKPSDGSFQPDIHQTLTESLRIQKNSEENFINPSEIEVPDTTDIADYFNRKVGYFCIGNGGINNTPLEVAKPRNYESRLYNMVPFRCVPVSEGDLSEEERQRYRFRRKEMIGTEWYYTYYLKKYTLENICVENADGTDYVIQYDHSNPIMSGDDSHPLLNTSVHVFFEMSLYIDAEDFKEYYKATNSNSLVGAKLTEFGLVLGNEKQCVLDGVTYDEVYNAELFSHVSHSPSYMDMEENAKMVTYTIFS